MRRIRVVSAKAAKRRKCDLHPCNSCMAHECCILDAHLSIWWEGRACYIGWDSRTWLRLIWTHLNCTNRIRTPSGLPNCDYGEEFDQCGYLTIRTQLGLYFLQEIHWEGYSKTGLRCSRHRSFEVSELASSISNPNMSIKVRRWRI